MTALHSSAGAPIIDSAAIAECVRADFGVNLRSISQVLGGQDSAAIVCRATTDDGAAMAVKVSRGTRVHGLLVCAALAGSACPGIPAPLLTREGRPYSTCQGKTLSVTPWIVGRVAYETGLAADRWREFGKLLSRVHGTSLPPPIRDQLPVERYRTPAVAGAREIDERIRAEQVSFLSEQATSSADELIREWSAASDSIALILDHIDELGDELRATPVAPVVTHGDAHIGNLLLDKDDQMWLLDWDEVALAPRERDLMFLMGGVLSDAPVTPEQQNWFFEGYGPAEIDQPRLAYYQCSWAVQDLADFAARILEHPGRSATSDQALRFIRGILTPTGIVQLACRSLQQVGHAEVLL